MRWAGKCGGLFIELTEPETIRETRRRFTGKTVRIHGRSHYVTEQLDGKNGTAFVIERAMMQWYDVRDAAETVIERLPAPKF